MRHNSTQPFCEEYKQICNRDEIDDLALRMSHMTIARECSGVRIRSGVPPEKFNPCYRPRIYYVKPRLPSSPISSRKQIFLILEFFFVTTIVCVVLTYFFALISPDSLYPLN